MKYLKYLLFFDILTKCNLNQIKMGTTDMLKRFYKLMIIIKWMC